MVLVTGCHVTQRPTPPGKTTADNLVSPAADSDIARREAVEAIHNHQYQLASDILLKAFHTDPSRLDILNDYCVVLGLQGRYQTALQTLQALLRQHPDNKQGLVNLGALYLSMGRPRDAVPPLEKAARLDPNDRNAQKALAQARATHPSADPTAPASDFSTTEGARDPLRLAEEYASQRKLDKALDQCNKVLAVDPQNGDARRLRTQIMTAISVNLDKGPSPAESPRVSLAPRNPR